MPFRFTRCRGLLAASALLLSIACEDWFAAPPPAGPMPGLERPLALTQHARERLSCRQITEAEASSVLQTGRLIPERTRLDGECPSHAFEGSTASGRALRVVVAVCPEETRLVTVVDLDRSWPCDE